MIDERGLTLARHRRRQPRRRRRRSSSTLPFDRHAGGALDHALDDVRERFGRRPSPARSCSAATTWRCRCCPTTDPARGSPWHGVTSAAWRGGCDPRWRRTARPTALPQRATPSACTASSRPSATPLYRGLTARARRAPRARAGRRRRDRRRQPHLVLRLRRPAAVDPAPGVLHRQGRVHGVVDDAAAVPGDGPDPDRARAGAQGDGRPRGRRRRAPAAATSSASTRRARGRATACCTAATPVSPSWR